MSDVRCFCLKPNVVVTYKKFLFIKFHKRSLYVPCGVCSGCLFVKADCQLSRFREEFSCSDVNYLNLLREVF